jgi:hypothetical protein
MRIMRERNLQRRVAHLNRTEDKESLVILQTRVLQNE